MNKKKDSNGDGDGWSGAKLAGEPADWAALYVLGALSSAERELCERRLATDVAFRAEVEKLRPTVAALSQAAAPVAPPAGLYERVRARAGLAVDQVMSSEAAVGARAAQPWKQWRAEKGAHAFDYLAADSSAFTPTAMAGISVRKLYVDPAVDRVTMLVRMSAGSSYPRHRHAGAEECYVLAGDIRVGSELHMHAGDYQRAEAESVHPVQSTDGGCLLLITSSLHDELLAVG
jgi:anti-sigma factor ChrR (cupin superfamily)